MAHRRTDSVCSVSSAASTASVASTSSVSSISSTSTTASDSPSSLSSSTYSTTSAASDWVHVAAPTFFSALPPAPPLATKDTPPSPGGRRHSVGLGLAPSLCDFNPGPHRPPPRPQLRPLILAAKHPLDPSLPLL